MVACPVLLACALAACGRIGFDASGPDAGPQGLFGAPSPLTELNTLADDSDASLTDDLLEIYFSSTRSGARAIWRATRATAQQQFDPPQLVPELTLGFSDRPRVSRDGLVIHLTGGGGGMRDVYVATRPDRASAWLPPSRVPELSSARDDFPGGLSRDGLRIYVDSEDGVPGQRDIYRFERVDDAAPWGNRASADGLNTDAVDGDAHEFASGAGIVFFSGRPGGTGLNDLYEATLEGGTWSVREIAELNTPGHDENAWISEDGRTIVFASGMMNALDLMIATR